MLVKLSQKQVKENLPKLNSGWKIKNKRLAQTFIFKNFKSSINFLNKVATLSERADHHPDIHVFYNKVTLELWTHKVKGLAEKDFDLASKFEKLRK